MIVLQEEAAEVIQAVSKCFRFGETDRNIGDLVTEIGDFMGVLKCLVEEGYIDPDRLMQAGDNKQIKLEKYMINKKVQNEKETR